jgi:hypothetical protein
VAQEEKVLLFKVFHPVQTNSMSNDSRSLKAEVGGYPVREQEEKGAREKEGQ